MFGVVVTLLAVVLLAYFVIKNYYPPVRRPLRILRRVVSAVWASTSWPSAASRSI